MLEFRLLGPLEVLDSGRPVSLPKKQRALLAVLLLHAGELVPVDRLIDEIWGEAPPATAKGALHNTVSQLRKTLGADVIRTVPSGYVLETDADHVDVARFERLVAEAQRAEAPVRAAKLREALALWRGPALADLAFEPFAAVEATRLEELRVVAREELIDARLALGEHAEVVPELEVLVAEQPLRERPRLQLMLALYRAGRQADALDVYQEGRRLLRDELGLEPSPPLRDLQQAILRQDVALVPPAPAVSAAIAGEERRKLVTVVFADVVNSTALGERLDPEALRDVIMRLFAAMRRVVEYHGGIVEKFAGDEVMAVFGVPSAHEDDALRAVRAAVDMRAAVAAVNEDLERERGVTVEVRTGINSGEVVAGDAALGELVVTGDAVNVAKRLEQAAPPDEVLLGTSTLRLVRGAVRAEPLDPLALPGKAQPVPAFRLVELLREPPGLAPRADTPLVDRQSELADLERAFGRVETERRCLALTVAGEPGIGKSRLAAEFCSQLGTSATVLAGRCVSYGEGATWLPLAEVLQQALGPSPEQSLASLLAGDEHAGRVGQAVSALLGDDGATGSPSSIGESFWAVRRLLEALAHERPLVLVLEDVHWAEPTLLDLVEYLEGFGSGGPMLVLCLARPELLGERPGWAERAITLEPLPEQAVRALIDNLSLPTVNGRIRDRMADAAEGNPLFAEQLLAWTAEGGGVDAVPPSLEALLQSRLDRLATEERPVLERAAVVGREFTPGAVRALSPPEASASLSTTLLELARKGFLDPAPALLSRQDGFRFHHALVRDVAYAGVPKALRADLHERVAEWLEVEGEAQDEVVGYHLEQAYRYRAELGPVDRHTRALAADAGRRLGEAGIRAWKRADVPAAVNLLTRATSLLPAEDEFRRELLCELGVALRTGGDIERAKAALAEAVATSAAIGDRRLELRGRLELAHVELMRQRESAADELAALAASSIPVFEALGDDRSLARTWVLVGWTQGAFRCRMEAWREAAERAIVHYLASGWPPDTAVAHLATALYHGPTRVAEAAVRCRELLRDPSIGRSGEAHVITILAALEALTGRFERARTLARQARRTYEELGLNLAMTSAAWLEGEIELLAGGPAAAEQRLRAACDGIERMQEYVELAARAAELAEALYAQRRHAEAEEWIRVSQLRASPRDLTVQIAWRSVGAKLLARRGAYEEAEALAREALTLVQETDALNQHAKASLDLAEVHRLAGRFDDAIPMLAQALDLYQRKQNRVGVRRVETMLRQRSPVEDQHGKPAEGFP